MRVEILACKRFMKEFVLVLHARRGIASHIPFELLLRPTNNPQRSLVQVQIFFHPTAPVVRTCPQNPQISIGSTFEKVNSSP